MTPRAAGPDAAEPDAPSRDTGADSQQRTPRRRTGRFKDRKITQEGFADAGIRDEAVRAVVLSIIFLSKPIAASLVQAAANSPESRDMMKIAQSTTLKQIPRGENAKFVFRAVERITGGNPGKTFTTSMVVSEILKLGYRIPEYTARCHIVSASPNHKHKDHYHGWRDKYWWLSGNGSNAEFRLHDPETDRKDID